ncbi:hypothetical protein [Halorientalis marina]|uniref:hypothetical protein n=1 Tax=Halorientalis marina TaxID=2931976 RepID=UPI001FF643B4|nr:hypothetical protein [Halorientalis marina]
MTEQTKIRYQHPEQGEIFLKLNPDERECLDSALHSLDVEMGLFINMAFKWGRANHPEVNREVTDRHKRKIRRAPDRTEKIKQEANEVLLKRRVMDFAEFVTTENPDSEWLAGNGELEMWGDLA